MSTSQEDDQALERLVRAGRVDPDDAQLRRLEERFDTWLAESASPPSGSSPAATALQRSVRYAPLLGAALLVLGIGVFEVASNDGGAPAVREARRPRAADDRVTMVTETSRPARLSTEEPAEPPATRSAVPVDALPGVSATPRRVPAPSNAKAPSPAEASPPSVVAPPSEPPAERASAERSETEVSYLRRSRSALHSAPERALSMADAHPSRFPHGALDQERELIAIDALVRLARRTEARERADRFRARYPSSAHLGRVSALVGGSQ